MKTTTRRQAKKNTTIAPPRSHRKQRRFAKVDVANLSDDDDNENPDWLIGAY